MAAPKTTTRPSSYRGEMITQSVRPQGRLHPPVVAIAAVAVACVTGLLIVRWEVLVSPPAVPAQIGKSPFADTPSAIPSPRPGPAPIAPQPNH